MYAEELCFAPKYVRLKQLARRRGAGRADAGQAVGEARRPARRRILGRQPLRRRRHDGHGLPRHRVLPLDARQAGQPRRRSSRVYAQMSTHVHGDKTRRRRQRDRSSSSSRTAPSPWPRRAGRSSAAWTTAPRSTAPRASPTPTCCTATRSRPTAPGGYGYAVEKAGSTEGLELHDLRGGLELRLPAGDGALRRLRAERQGSRW